MSSQSPRGASTAAGANGHAPKEDRSFIDDYLLTVLHEKDELGLRLDDVEKEVK